MLCLSPYSVIVCGNVSETTFINQQTHAHAGTHSSDLKVLSGTQCQKCSDKNFTQLLIVFAAEAKHAGG